MTTLLLRLSGPMQSWGTQSRFSIRDTGLEPSKSGVVGLLCAALGKPRKEGPADKEQWPRLSELAALKMGVRVDRPGTVRRDYQTAGGTHLKGERYGVAKANGAAPDTVVSHRYYLADAQFLVGLEGERTLLERLQQALQEPVWPLYLGRKSFVPSSPVTLADGILDVGLEQALSTYAWLARTEAEAVAMRRRAEAASVDSEPVQLRLVLDAPFGSTPDIRNDVPLDFVTRTFALRYVRVTSVSLSPETIREEALCFSHA